MNTLQFRENFVAVIPDGPCKKTGDEEDESVDVASNGRIGTKKESGAP